MRIGFTGTRRGMTAPQRNALVGELHRLGAIELHHGDCWGADEEADDIAVRLGVRRVAHPPTASGLRAFCTCEEIRTPAPFLVRNKTIVLETEMLVAAPEGRERTRSGTWSTVRYARRMILPRIVISPLGEVLLQVPGGGRAEQRGLFDPTT